jgi:hypothetical protein
MKNIIFALAFLGIISCSKTTEEPSVSSTLLIGKWKDNGYVEKFTITENGKNTIINNSIPASSETIEFKTDGTVNYYGSVFKYNIAGSTLTFSSGSTTYDYTIAKADGKVLTLTFTKDQFYKYLPSIYDVKGPEYIDYQNKKSKITTFEYSENFVK